MTPAQVALDLFPGRFVVCRLAAEAPVPEWAVRAPWFSITRTAAELSIVCPEAEVPSGVRAEGPWRLLGVRGPLDFALTGVLASLTTPLAAAGVSVFAIATYDTDYLLVREADLARTRATLAQAGHEVADQ